MKADIENPVEPTTEPVDLGAQNVDFYQMPTGEKPVVAEEKIVEEIIIDGLTIDFLDSCKFVNPKGGTVEFELNYAINHLIESGTMEDGIGEFVYRINLLRIDACDSTKNVIDLIKIKIG